MGFLSYMEGHMKISVCMIVKNEENMIARALSSIPQEYEIIVVDTGSTDQTLDIAAQYGAQITEFPWCNDFSAARNASIVQASGDYILLLDADEELFPDTARTVQAFVRNDSCAAGTVVIHNVIGEEIHKHRMVRLFPNQPEYRFQGPVHEQLYYQNQPCVFKSSQIKIKHYGYEAEVYAQAGKFERYESLYKAQLTNNPNDGYMLYQLGKLYFSCDRYQQAIETLLQSFEQREERNLYFPVMLVMLGYALKKLGEYGLAEDLLLPYVSMYPDFPDIPFLLGLLGMDTGRLSAIEQYFRAALKAGETDKYSSVNGTGSFKAAYNLGVFYEVTNQANKAKRYYRQSADAGYGPATQRLLNL
jgi:glycosyltransferase involved in cell wall biosynthesis